MKPVLIALVVLIGLAGCSAAVNEAIDAAEGVVEQKVDATIARGIERACKGPIDVMMRANEAYPALLAFVTTSCPATYGRLRDALLAVEASGRPVTLEDLRRELAK